MSIKEAIATHLGWDIAEIEYYQPCTWSHKLVVSDDNWYCATRTKKAPRVTSSTLGYQIDGWVLAEAFGNIKVWRKSL